MKGLVFASLWLSGCAYKLSLVSTPSGADVVLPGRGEVAPHPVTTPAVVAFRWVPFGKQPVVASAPGYRPLAVDLRKQDIRLWALLVGTVAHPDTLWGRPRGEVRFLLIPEHGPAGTWTEDARF